MDSRRREMTKGDAGMTKWGAGLNSFDYKRNYLTKVSI
jgi:hypothetical protein